jgi:hypothetical protein
MPKSLVSERMTAAVETLEGAILRPGGPVPCLIDGIRGVEFP